MNWLTQFDYTVFTWINGLAGHNSFIDTIMKAACNDHLVPMTMGFLVLVMALRGRTREDDRAHLGAVVELFLTVVLANALVQLVVVFVTRQRPFIDPSHTVNLLFYKPTDSSFPSNPAATTFAFYFAALLADRRFSWCFLAPAVLMSFSRIFSGVCYPGDVLAGAVIALGAALFVHHAGVITMPLKQLTWSIESYCRGASSLRE